jgi:hypothetical protein
MELNVVCSGSAPVTDTVGNTEPGDIFVLL